MNSLSSKSFLTLLLFLSISFAAISQPNLSGAWKGETSYSDWTGAVETYIKKTGDYTYTGVNHIIWSKPGEQSREVKKRFQAVLNGDVFNIHEYEFIQRLDGGVLTDYQLTVHNINGQVESIGQLSRFSITIPQEYEAYLGGTTQQSPQTNNNASTDASKVLN